MALKTAGGALKVGGGWGRAGARHTVPSRGKGSGTVSGIGCLSLCNRESQRVLAAITQCRTLCVLAIQLSRWWVLQGLSAVPSLFRVMNLA